METQPKAKRRTIVTMDAMLDTEFFIKLIFL